MKTKEASMEMQQEAVTLLTDTNERQEPANILVEATQGLEPVPTQIKTKETPTALGLDPTATPREFKEATITLRLEPANTVNEVPRPKTVLQLLNRLSLRHTACLVIRDDAGGKRTLLTPDLKLASGDVITVRKVTSSG